MNVNFSFSKRPVRPHIWYWRFWCSFFLVLSNQKINSYYFTIYNKKCVCIASDRSVQLLENDLCKLGYFCALVPFFTTFSSLFVIIFTHGFLTFAFSFVQILLRLSLFGSLSTSFSSLDQLSSTGKQYFIAINFHK